MFLGFVELEGTLIRHLQLANGNAAAAPDNAPVFRVYGASDTAVATGSCSTTVDSQTGFHKLTQIVAGAGGFARGTYTIQIYYAVSLAAKVQQYTFTVV